VGTSTTTATVVHCTDLQITKTAAPATVAAGQDLVYTIKVKNIGPSDIAAGEFTVTDAPFPPTGTTLKVGTTISAPGFGCNLDCGIPVPIDSATAGGCHGDDLVYCGGQSRLQRRSSRWHDFEYGGSSHCCRRECRGFELEQ
jgi:uncharacterized repeat protein (TIGR01451 family)